MVLTYLGKSFVKITQGNLTVAVNPIGKSGAWPNKPTKFAADIVLSSLHDENYNGVDTVTYGETLPFAITGPGDYEVKDVFIKGVPIPVTRDGDEMINTAYTIVIDGVTLCFLGAIKGDVPTSVREDLMHPDILFVPIGGGEVIEASAAYKLATALEPMIIIPLEWSENGGDAALKKFLKDAGEENAPRTDKLALKRKDLDGKEGDVMIIEVV